MRHKKKEDWVMLCNLLLHIHASHPNYQDILASHDSLTQCAIDKFFDSTTAGKMYARLDLIINGMLPFNIVQ